MVGMTGNRGWMASRRQAGGGDVGTAASVVGSR